MTNIFRAYLYLACSLSVLAQQTPAHRPKVALVLEGGGALGFAHIGVIQYLEEQHIPVDLVVGTSMGGLVGGLYALGNSPSEIVALTGQIDWNAVLSGRTAFQDLTFRRKEDRIVFANRLEFGLKHRLSLPEGLNSGHQVGLILDRAAVAYGDKQQFDDLPIPFRCVATDLTVGKAKVFDRGSISEAMRATMSIPAVFSPVTIDDHLYSDGGAVDNLPVDVAKQAGAEVVIAVYLDQGATGAKSYGSLFSVAARNIEAMIAANEMRNMAAADVLVSANLQGWTASSFANGPEIIPRGYEAAKQKQRMLTSFRVNDTEWAEYLAQRNAKTKRVVPPPHSIDVITTDRHAAEVIKSELAVFQDKPLNTPAFNRALTRLTGDGTIDSLGYSLRQSGSAPAILEVKPFDKPYGPPFLNAGFLIDGSDPENVTFGIDARLTVRNAGGYRAEWRTDGLFGSAYGLSTEYYRPFSDIGKFFVAPRAYAIDSPFDLYSGGSRIGRYRIGREGFGFDGGYEFSRRSEIRIGEDLFWMQTRKKIVTDTYPDDSERETSTSIKYRYYGTDNVVVPRSGFQAEANFTYYRRDSPNKSFPQAELRAGYFIPVSKPGSLLFTASGGTAFGTNTLDLQLQSFSLGGPLRLGAYGKNELLGNQYFLFQAGYLHKLLSFSPLVGEGLYGTAFVEAGKIYGSTASPFLDSTFPVDGSVAVVARTALGPVFLGGSLGEGGHRKWWFGIGRVF